MRACTHTHREFRRSQRFSSVGLLVGTLLSAFSLTPSLLPRSVPFQGLVSGISMALGYSVGRGGRGLWYYLELPVRSERVQRKVILSIAALCAVVAVLFLARATDWQNSVSDLMGLEPVSGVRPFSVALMASSVFGVLHFLGWQFRKTFLFLSGKLRRAVPRRVASLLGLVGAAALFLAIADGVLLSALLRAADGSFREMDAAIQDDIERPGDPMRTGSAASIIEWGDLGKRGRTFVSSGPTAPELGAYHGRFRIVYLQYASDPVTFFSVRSFYRQPDWLRRPRGHDVSPKLQWYPVVTAVQLAADMAATLPSGAVAVDRDAAASPR